MIKENLKLSFTKNCTNEEVELLRSKLIAYNTKKITDYQFERCLFACHDEHNELIAGLYAINGLGRFFIDLLWVDSSYRHQGLGLDLLRRAEDLARNSNALYVRVNTATFQALDFYLKNGYQVFAKLPIKTNIVEQQFDYFLVKYLN